MLFSPKNKRKFEVFWAVLILVIIASMILAYTPALFR